MDYEQQDVGSSKFKWRATTVDLGGEWGFGNVAPRVIFDTIIARLHDFESMKWEELMRRPSTHYMPKEAICAAAQRRLNDIKRDDIDTLFQLNVRGGQRLWGVKEGAIFYLLWWDPDHTVYPVEKRHT